MTPLATIPESERAAEKMPYNGGLVQEGPIHVYLTFWGSGWNQHPADKEHVLEMFRYLDDSPYTGILSQYFDHTGHPSGQVSLSSYTDGSVTTPETVSETKIELEAKKSIESQGWPAPAFDDTYVVLPAPGATEQLGFETGCARHGFDTELGAPFAFAWFPTSSEHDACLEGRETWEVLQADAAFEFAQAATDPQPYNTFGNTLQSGWNKPTGEVHEGKVATTEIGEACFGHGVAEEAPEVWLPRILDDYLLAEQGIKCAAQDKEPVRYSLSVGATQIAEPHQATVTGTVIPGGWPARYRFNVSDPATGYSATVPAEFQPVVATNTGETVSAKIPTVTGGQTYSVTLESYNALTEADPPLSTGTSVLSASGSFSTPGPTVSEGASTKAVETGATLKGAVNPNGVETSYRFEYGTTASYGSSVPIPEGKAGHGTGQDPVSAELSGLTPGTIYHWRLVATSPAGTTAGADQTFETEFAGPTILWSKLNDIGPRRLGLATAIHTNGFETTLRVEYGIADVEENQEVGTTFSGEQPYEEEWWSGGYNDQGQAVEPDTSYHIRATAVSGGYEVHGQEFTVTTPSE